MTQPKTIEAVDAIMARIPERHRYRWCGAERGPCACIGCVQICSRALMYEVVTGRDFVGDPEGINPWSVPAEIRELCTITRDEWEAWKVRHPDQNTPQGNHEYRIVPRDGDCP